MATPSFNIKTVSIDTIRGYAANARIIPQEAIEKVAASIREFGWQQPIVVDEDGVILAGHTRHLAAKHLGLKEVPVHLAVGLTKDQADLYRLMDNRSNQESGWDNDLVTQELADLKGEGYDLAMTGFNANEVTTYLAELSGSGDADEIAKAKKPASFTSASDTPAEKPAEKPAPGARKKPKIICPRCGKHFVEA